VRGAELRWQTTSLLVRGCLDEQLQHGGPAATALEPLAHGLAVNEPLKEPVFQLDRGLLGSVGVMP
jgi:hypothetical protein